MNESESEIPKLLEEMEQYHGVDRFRVNPVTIREWVKALSPFTIGTVRMAWERHIHQSQKIPMLSDILGICRSITGARGERLPLPAPEKLRPFQESNRNMGLELIVYEMPDGRRASRWVRREWCVKHRGVWKEKIDFVIDVFGASEISEECKRIAGASSLTDLVSRPAWVVAYREWLDDTTELALQRAG